MSDIRSLLPDDPRDGALVDVIDRLLDQGVVIRGELWLTVADVELVFIGADLIVTSPDRMKRPASDLMAEA